MIDSPKLLSDLKAQLKVLQADLKERADDPATPWGAHLQREHAEALRRERTGLSWTAWRDNEVDQAAVAWIVATTFVRFCEDNDLLAGATMDGVPTPVGWIAGPGERTARARENQTAYFRVNTSHHDRDWLQQAFRVLAAQPAGAALVDPRHNPVWTAEISAEAATALVAFWRRTDDDGTLTHDFTDPDLGTRFLGDLYQDLSEHAKKTYALLQTPVFVEELILDRALTPAVAEFGVDGLRLIDPTCGSGHFLLGAFERLNAQWAAEAPGMDRMQRVRKSMDSIYGVDLNPFAVAIARFRLTVAGILAAGEKSLVGVPPLGFHLAIGDSLLGAQGTQGELEIDGVLDVGGNAFALGDTLALDAALVPDEGAYTYATEDVNEYRDILTPGRYHVVVGNPPYINPGDKALNAAYRKAYTTCKGKYALSVPFAELFFRLALRGEPGRSAGHVAQITSNSFMKREFGSKLIEDLFAGKDPKLAVENPVDLTHVLDIAGAWIPGHNHDGTPTVILVGRRRRPVYSTVRAVLGVRDDPGKRSDPENGPVWSEMIEHLEDPGFEGSHVSVTDLARDALAAHPWSLSGGGAGDLKAHIDARGSRPLKSVVSAIGVMGMTNIDDAFLAPASAHERFGVERALVRPLVTGPLVRDYQIELGDSVFFAYEKGGLVDILDFPGALRRFWPTRSEAWSRQTFNKVSYRAEGRSWWEWHQITLDRVDGMRITFAEVATHGHFVLDRRARVSNQTAPVIKLPDGATDVEHWELLGVLNSALVCFWLKEVCKKKGGDADTPWLRTYQFNSTRVQSLPLPGRLPGARGSVLDDLSQALEECSPREVIDQFTRESGSVGAASRSGVRADLRSRLARAEGDWHRIREQLVFAQEELDWEVYALYGLTEEDLTYSGSFDCLGPAERAFAIRMARTGGADPADAKWFDYEDPRTGQRQHYKPLIDLPEVWPGDYRALVSRRLAVIDSDPAIGFIEKPEYKRRWAAVPWERQVSDALEAAIMSRLEDPVLWSDAHGCVTRSVAGLVDLARHDEVLMDLTRALTGTLEPDLVGVLTSLCPKEAVPYLAAHRYKASSRELFEEWQGVWDLQRREDSGKPTVVPAAPGYESSDFTKPEYWKSRGRLDVPKERFILYPGVGRESDSTPVLGWAGWNHRDQAVALVREVMNQQALGASDETLVPMVAGLVELEPWLHQWHTDLEPEFGSSAAAAVTSQIDQLLAHLQMTRDDVSAWRPPAPTRGRRPRT